MANKYTLIVLLTVSPTQIQITLQQCSQKYEVKKKNVTKNLYITDFKYLVILYFGDQLSLLNNY